MRPAKTQISLGIRPVWSESTLSTWRKLGSLATHWVHSEDSDQTGWMPRLTWVFAGRTAILLVLSWGGSFRFLCLLACLFWFNVALNNFSVISRWCLVATGSPMFTYIVLPDWSIMPQILDIIPNPVILSWFLWPFKIISLILSLASQSCTVTAVRDQVKILFLYLIWVLWPIKIISFILSWANR